MNVTTTEARYSTTCPACEKTIQVGELIIRDPLDGAGQTWIHAQCPAGRRDVIREICDECWTEKSVSGACLCPEAP